MGEGNDHMESKKIKIYDISTSSDNSNMQSKKYYIVADERDYYFVPATSDNDAARKFQAHVGENPKPQTPPPPLPGTKPTKPKNAATRSPIASMRNAHGPAYRRACSMYKSKVHIGAIGKISERKALRLIKNRKAVEYTFDHDPTSQENKKHKKRKVAFSD